MEKTPRPFSGHCATAAAQPNPLTAHERCKLEGCVCSCHTPKPQAKLRVAFACLTGSHVTCLGHGPEPTCECPDVTHTMQPRVVSSLDWDTEPDDPHDMLADLEAAAALVEEADQLEPPGTQIALAVHNHEWTPQDDGTRTCACGAAIAGGKYLDPGGPILGTAALGSTDPHLWPVELGRIVTDAAVPLGTVVVVAPGPVKLTDDEKRRVIAAHLEYEPAAILETVAAIITERTAQ